jgi:gamma-glutamyltranspeptidase/glutathione hydrolase
MNIQQAGISGGHGQTCEIALDVMREGGNAVDAAIAAFAAMFVTEPAMASPGGGAFATVLPSSGKPTVFDFFCHTPRHKKAEHEVSYRPITVDFGDDTELFFAGNGSTSTPGAIAGIFSMHEALGTIPLTELFAPSIRLMKEGVTLNAFQAFDLGLLSDIFLMESFGQSIFMQDGRLKKEGEQIQMPELADFMETLAIEGRDLFYKGEIAKECAQILGDEGGLLLLEDFEAYECVKRNPRSFSISDWHVHTVPAPFLGGAIFEFLSRAFFNERSLGLDFYPAMYRAICQVLPMVKNQSQLEQALRQQHPPLPRRRGSTSHFSLVDKSGMAVSLTTSIGEGSGLFLPSSGIHMNNMLGELALLPGDLHSWWPDCRLNSMMSPTIAKSQKGGLLVMGTGGAGRIPFVLSQMLGHYLSASEASLDELIARPRIFATDEVFHYERPIAPGDWVNQHEKWHVWGEGSLFFGGINAILRRNKDFVGAADRRRQGVVRML